MSLTFSNSRLKTLAELTLFAATFGSLAVSARAQVYDLRVDFSGSSNPNGAWSYELSGAPITSTLNPGYGAGWGYYDSADASILKVATTIDSNFQVGDVVLHAPSVPYGGPSVYLDVKWTAPANGVISIDGKAWAASFANGRDAQWWLSVGGTTLASNASIYGVNKTDSAAQFASNLLPSSSLSGIDVTAGETVTFNVAATTFYGHFVGAEETITFTAVPEPSSTGVAATAALLSLATLKHVQRRQRGAQAV